MQVSGNECMWAYSGTSFSGKHVPTHRPLQVSPDSWIMCVCGGGCGSERLVPNAYFAHPMNRLPGELSDLLQMSDYVCSILPETPDTKGLLDGNILRHCAKKVSPTFKSSAAAQQTNGDQ